jgi:hypothetical protein
MDSPSVARSSRSWGVVAAFPWNQWQPSPGISGKFAVESVAGLAWNTHATLPDRLRAAKDAGLLRLPEPGL